MLKPEEVEAKVEEIRSLVKEDRFSEAHMVQDVLYEKVLRDLANIPNNVEFTYFDLAELVKSAQAALETEDIEDFVHWYS